ncbi:hypothetical protein E3U55_07465 [Filobacillus milosensis]|uniref:Yip1 domain-containing protein n=1 Tax=Filobacillus milosensis TaxID=94137 RepID=A0A4Y8IT84_9BACI|nr:hypothetical protein [Filobacillus milosensis]TFB22132.1 hypothetical protein E3U55_07465 [Filobacillus milosensis]
MDGILPRKFISASISGSLFAIVLALIVPDPFGETINSISEYMLAFISTVPIYLIYSVPVVLTYGLFTSIISDKLAKFILRNIQTKKIEMFLSFIFHSVFGLILLPYSLGAAIMFFITDRLIQKYHKGDLLVHAFISLAIPLTLWLFFVVIHYFIY